MIRARNHSTAVLLALLLLLYCVTFSHAQWKPAGAKLMTRWGKTVSPAKVHQEYPRPQLVRGDWVNLNGLWDYAIRPAAAESPKQADGKILVPFPVESALSGVGRMVGKEKRVWYRRTFKVPGSWKGSRVLLHFGAVDWEAKVWVNGKPAGSHRGGYDSFTFDVTDLLASGGGSQRLEVSAWDPSDEGPQPRGKQVSKPGGIWYTPVTGIWQTVWLEAVPLTSISSLHIEPDVDGKRLKVAVETLGTDKVAARVNIPALGVSGEGAPGSVVELALKEFELWSPENPKLYDLEVELLSGGKTVDRVKSYFGMRKIALGKDRNGIPRILLNGEPLFQFGPLDQGWWPDGLYTAPSDEALRYDLEVTKKLGFNMVRKHVKVEPLRWYYHCDRMGLLVWQDMPSGGANARWPLDGTELRRDEKEKAQFDRELDALIDSHRNQVSIVAWVPFNEAWGQFDTARVTRRIEEKDPGRLVISASGGNDFGIGHVHDIHQYPGPRRPPAETARAAVLGEYGGLGLPLKGHTWQNAKNWGYRSFKLRG
ncbi:MAG: beta-galactosidase, partial [Planctomycetes bacterium]|nr:beta-galactosidase [Planctomycetota bacterium]